MLILAVSQSNGVLYLYVHRERGFESLLSSLETRYAEKPGKGKKSRKSVDASEEPSEEAFLAAQKRLKLNKRK